MVRLKFLFASSGHVDFLDCTNEISKCFECECEAFRLIKCAPQIYLRAISEVQRACKEVHVLQRSLSS